MYAIVKVGGNQYRVEPGETLVVDRLDGKIGDQIKLETLLFVDGATVKVGPEARKVEVMAKIKEHEKGDKIDTYHFRAKSRSRRHVGFRPSLTTLTIESIGGSAPVKTASKSAAGRKLKSK